MASEPCLVRHQDTPLLSHRRCSAERNINIRGVGYSSELAPEDTQTTGLVRHVCDPAPCTVCSPCCPHTATCTTGAFYLLVHGPEFYVCPSVMRHSFLYDPVYRGDPVTRGIPMQPNGVDAISFTSCCNVALFEQKGKFVERDFELHHQPCNIGLLISNFSDRSSGV